MTSESNLSVLPGFSNFGSQPYVCDERFVSTEVEISITTDLAKDLASAMYEALLGNGYDVNPVSNPKAVTVDQLTEMFVGLLLLRLQQVSGGRPPRGYRWQDIRVPSLMYSVLAEIGNFKDERRGIELKPVIAKNTGDASVEELDLDTMPEKLDMLTRALSKWGVGFSEGLPKERNVTSDVLFQLERLNAHVLGHDREPDVVVLAVRSLIEFSALSNVFGQPRIIYATIDMIRRSFQESVTAQIKHPSQLRG